MYDARTRTDPLKPYTRIICMLLAAFLLYAGLVEYGTQIFACTPGACDAPGNTILVFSEVDHPQGGLRQTVGLYARDGIPAWIGWVFGLIAPVALLVTAFVTMPRRPWKG